MIINLILLLMSIEDLYHLEVNDIAQVSLFLTILATANITVIKLLIAALVFGIYIVYEKSFSAKIGGADIKILCSLFLLGGIQMIIKILFIASLFGIGFALITNKKKLPFVPFIWIGYLLVNV